MQQTIVHEVQSIAESHKSGALDLNLCPLQSAEVLKRVDKAIGSNTSNGNTVLKGRKMINPSFETNGYYQNADLDGSNIWRKDERLIEAKRLQAQKNSIAISGIETEARISIKTCSKSDLSKLGNYSQPFNRHKTLSGPTENEANMAPEASNSSTAGSEKSGERRKRKSDSSDEEASLKPYECRFCPMKFAKSQALGGHMNRHRQEREREQLLHARQLVMQQGYSSLMLPGILQQQSPYSGSPLHGSSLLNQQSISISNGMATLGWNMCPIMPSANTSMAVVPDNVFASHSSSYFNSGCATQPTTRSFLDQHEAPKGPNWRPNSRSMIDFSELKGNLFTSNNSTSLQIGGQTGSPSYAAERPSTIDLEGFNLALGNEQTRRPQPASLGSYLSLANLPSDESKASPSEPTFITYFQEPGSGS